MKKVKRRRPAAQIPNRLVAKWADSGSQGPDIYYSYGYGVPRSDAHLLHGFLCYAKFGEKTLLEELKDRGYIIETLRFEIYKLPGERRTF